MSGSDFYDRYGAGDSDSLEDAVPIYGDVTEDPDFVSPDDLPDPDEDIFGRKRAKTTTVSGFGGVEPEKESRPRNPKILGGILVAVIVISVIAISSFGSSGDDTEPAQDVEATAAPSSDLPLPTMTSPTATKEPVPWPTEKVGDVIKGSGKGDLTTAAGVIQRYNWAYYEGIDPESAADTFDPDNGWTIDDIKESVEENKKGTEATTETTITDEQDVFDVVLTVKVPGDGDDKPEEFSFKQKYILSYDDGRFWILDKQDLGEA